MVQRILNILNKEIIGLHQAAYLLGVFALMSQVLGLVRDRLLAHFFGAGITLDIYYAAFRIQDFLYVSIASFVSLTVLIPFLVRKIDSGELSAKKFVNDVFSVFFVSIIAISIIVFIFIPVLADFIVPGFSDKDKVDFINLSRILLLSPILLGLSSLLGSITQTFRKFFVYASAPVLYNIGIIIGIVFLMPMFGIYGVVYGVILGSIFHLSIQIPVVLKHGLIPKFSLRVNISEIKDVIKLSLPRTLALSSSQIALVALFALASLMTEGSISIFNFSLNLQSVPLSIIGVSYSVAAFPTLARLFSNGDRIKFAQHVASASRHIIFWSIPAIVLFVVLRAQIVRTILGSGAFDWADTRLTAAALAVFAISITAHSLMLLLVRGYYAAGKTKTPLFLNVSSSILIIILGFVFVRLFQEVDTFRYFFEALLRIEDLSGTVIVMLPLAYSIGMIINGLLMMILFERDFKEFSFPIERAFVESFGASIIMGFVAYKFLTVFDGVFNNDTLLGVFSQGFFSGVLGIMAGVLVLKLLGNKEIKEIISTFKRRLKWVGGKIIAPDQEEL